MNPLKECIDAYVALGWRVLPLCYPVDGKCTCGRNCEKPGKSPHYKLAPNGSKGATLDPAIIQSWFDSGEKFNIGICAGPESGLVIVDIDPAHGGFDSLKKLIKQKIQTPTVLTGSGGGHLYFKHPGTDIRNSAGTVAPGIDVRGTNGYVVAPPSMHFCGKEYIWKIDARVPLAEMPTWVTRKTKKQDEGIEGVIPEGKRNDELTRIAGKLRRVGIDTENIYLHLKLVKCDPPMPDADLRRIANSVANYDPDPVESSEEIIVLPNDHPDTLAKAFEQWSREKCEVEHRYNHIDGWSIYKNGQYQIVEEEEIQGYIRQFLALCKVQKIIKNKEKVGWLDKTAKGSYNVRNILSWLKTPEMANVHLRPSQKAPCCLDRSVNINNIIAMNNGLLDITDRAHPVLLPFNKNIYTFNYLPFNYDPDRLAPTWLWALGQYFQDESGNPDSLAADILHSWILKILLRDTSQHKIFALIGRFRSGKSTIGRIISELVGTMNIVPITISSLSREFGLQPMLNKQLGIMWDGTVTGKNANVMAAVETLKGISGEDTFTVNRKNLPQLPDIKMKLLILVIANKVLDLKDSTGALPSRFTFLETTQSFYGHEDPSIEAKMMTELPGIFNLVLKAQGGRLQEHPRSDALKEDFTELASPYQAFVNQCCILDKEAWIPTEVLWAYYDQWCLQNKWKSISPQKFKLEFASSTDVQRYRPRLNNDEILELKQEYYLDQHLDHTFNLSNRPQCYSGIDIIENLKMGWFGQDRSRYGQDRP